MSKALKYDITSDDLSNLSKGNTFVTFGEVLLRDTPADGERPERTRLVHLSLAGSEYTLAVALSRMGIASAFITRAPLNPYGKSIQNIAREHGIDTKHIVWTSPTEPIGRFIYEIGRSPRRNIGVYQRKYSAASRLGCNMVNWKAALKDARLLHTSGISFGLSKHSGYKRNYNLEALEEAIQNKPRECLIGMDLNYRSTLWSSNEANDVLTPIITEHIDILITTIEDMAKLYNMDAGQYSAKQIVNGDIGVLTDEDIEAFACQVKEKFNTKIVGITIRYPDNFEQHRWESAAIDFQGNFFRSPSIKSITLLDRLGGGDTWNAGFYYGLMTSGFNQDGIEKGVLTGDAATRIKQTLMFDLPIIEKGEIQALLEADVLGGGKRTVR
ncbi:MAG: sugar kinase [Acidobacteriia bacterium]|nr:sugar kinase [Terriglobia bacterium]